MPDGPALALVPARTGSKGVPGKNLRRIGGVSLTALAVRCARATELFEEALRGKFGVVYTSDYVIDEAITTALFRTRNFGSQHGPTRPRLSED